MSGTILDVILVAVATLLIIFGIWRGMYKLIFGLVSALLVIVLAVVLVSPVSNFLVERTALDDRLVDAIDAPLTESLPNADAVIAYYDIDGDGVAAELGYMLDGELHALDEILEGSNYALLGGMLTGIVSGRIDPDDTQGVTFISVLSSVIVGYVLMAIVFVALLIIMFIVVRLVMMLIKKAVTRTYLGHYLNKLVGAILGLVLAMVLIWGSLAIIRLLSTYEWIIPVNAIIESSTLGKLLFDNNVIYSFLVDSFNIKEVIDNIIGGATVSG